MRIRTIASIAAVGAALLTATTPRVAFPQDGPTADFLTARRLVAEQQFGRAAYALGAASVYVRQEIGRSRDESVGMRLMDAESRLDGLVARVRASHAPSAASLDSVFAQTDRLLAEHHWRLAGWELANLRSASRASLGQDLGAAASHFARSFRFANQEPSAAAAQAIADARRVADTIASTDAVPKETASVLEALGRQIVPAVVIAIR